MKQWSDKMDAQKVDYRVTGFRDGNDILLTGQASAEGNSIGLYQGKIREQAGEKEFKVELITFHNKKKPDLKSTAKVNLSLHLR
jgi:hypothetical protein